MNATKRKFNALLSGIGNKSSTSLPKEVNNTDPASTGADIQAKKRRISGDSVPQPTSNSRVNVLSNSATMGHKKSASVAVGPVSVEIPKYAPWDRTEFLKRLKSFSNLTDWTPKPARVNEVEWAKRGWVCQKFERVRCCLCNVEILVKLNKKEVDGKEEPVYVAQNIEDALVERYVELIITSHDEDCLWRKRGCDDSIFKLPLNHAPTTLQTLRDRYVELRTRADTLPYYFNMKYPPELDLDLVLSYLPKDFFTYTDSGSTEGIPLEVNKVALIMALFGWQGHTHHRLGDQLGSVSCQACFRVLGLWLFKSKQVNEAGEEISGAAMNHLDVVLQHRDYCPWRNAASQNGAISLTNSRVRAMAGWEIVLRVLKNEYQLRHGKEAGEKVSKQAVVTEDTDSAFGAAVEDDDANSIRGAKDRERWTRLRRVKSLFDTKGSKKVQRSGTRAA